MPGKITKQELSVELATEINKLGTDLTSHETNDTAHGIGSKAQLMTSHKSTLVGAINEAFTSASNGKATIGSAITGTDPKVSVPSNPTFDQLAAAIRRIEVGRYKIGDTIQPKAYLEISDGIEWSSENQYKKVEHAFSDSSSNLIYLEDDAIMVKYSRITGSMTWRKSLLNNTLSAFIAKNDDVWVMSTIYQAVRIEIYNSLGNISRTFDITQTNGELLKMAMDAQSNVFIVGNREVVKINSSGTILWRSVISGSALSSPVIACDDSGYTYIGDETGELLKISGSTGSLLFRKSGRAAGGFGGTTVTSIRSIDVHKSSFLIITDGNSAYSLTTNGAQSWRTGNMSYVSVSIDELSDIYLSSQDSNGIRKFTSSSVFIKRLPMNGNHGISCVADSSGGFYTYGSLSGNNTSYSFLRVPAVKIKLI